MPAYTSVILNVFSEVRASPKPTLVHYGFIMIWRLDGELTIDKWASVKFKLTAIISNHTFQNPWDWKAQNQRMSLVNYQPEKGLFHEYQSTLGLKELKECNGEELAQ